MLFRRQIFHLVKMSPVGLRAFAFHNGSDSKVGELNVRVAQKWELRMSRGKYRSQYYDSLTAKVKIRVEFARIFLSSFRYSLLQRSRSR